MGWNKTIPGSPTAPTPNPSHPQEIPVIIHSLNGVGMVTEPSCPVWNSRIWLFQVSRHKFQFGEQSRGLEPSIPISCSSQGIQAWLCPARRIPGWFGLEKLIQCHLPFHNSHHSQVSPSPSRPWNDLPSSPPASSRAPLPTMNPAGICCPKISPKKLKFPANLKPSLPSGRSKIAKMREF